MRHRLVWAFLGALSVIYVGMLIWLLVQGDVTPTATDLAWVLFTPVPVALGGYLMWKKPENRIGELLAVSSALGYMALTILELPTVRAFDASGAEGWMWWPIWLAQTLSQIGIVITMAMIVTLPSGRFRYRRERRLVRWSWVIVAFPTLSLISNPEVLTHEFSFPGVQGVASPFFIDALLPSGSSLAALSSLSYSIFVIALVFLFLRYRGATERERKQVRWVLYGGAMAIVMVLIPYTLSTTGVTAPITHDLSAVWYSLPIVLLPLSIVVAVMEPPWIDVDIVIRKSVVYGALSFLILLLYVGVAAAAGVVIAEARFEIEVAILLTVLAALIFQPARSRLQVLADRWVFGVRPSRFQAVTEFGETVEQAADPTELLPRLAETLQKAIRLEWVAATLDDGARVNIGTVGDEPALTVPIGIGSEEIGLIECGPKLNGSIDDDERHLVQTLAAQVGLAVMNARLAGRIVNAAEAERRRIERNIHDGAQQELVALVAKLGMAKAATARGELTAEAVDGLQAEAQHILADLRELAQGIHPSVLSDGGILEAVEERCSHLPIEVSLNAAETLRTMRFNDDVEGAAYFFVSEALANVLKHADASYVNVTLEAQDDQIRLGVMDNGEGFDPETGQRDGLIGLSDRIRALGGTLTISSHPRHGTSLQATIPTTHP